MAEAFIGLGSNLGNRSENIESALSLLKEKGVFVLKCSTFIETDPVGYEDQPQFLNAVCKIQTALSPHDLLNVCLGIEDTLGRERPFANAPRTIDLDLLLYDNVVVSDEVLILPHPRMWQRNFVLEPLKEIAPDIIQRYNANH